MDVTSYLDWSPALLDPTGRRELKPRISGKTMVIDKGLGLQAFEDLLQMSGSFIDMIKIGFGTSVLYPPKLLQRKISLAKAHHIRVLPGGTFLEVAIVQGVLDRFFDTVVTYGFDAIEVSDGTIDIQRDQRTELILRGIDSGLEVFTEYGKKCWGSTIETDALIETIYRDTEVGASLVTVEGRESGVGVGIYDENGDCRVDDLAIVLDRLTDRNILMWEAPNKSQQVQLIKLLGTEVNLGNISPYDVYALEALRRGLRSDTFVFDERKQRAD
jgi:phosphosulfolactate synthase